MGLLRAIVRFFTTLMGMSNPEDLRNPPRKGPQPPK
jgi:hypothetical protein